MAARDRHEIQVGLALVVAVTVLIAGLLWFQRYEFGSQHRTVLVDFPTVGGLAVGDPVHVRGIPMGKVQTVELSGAGVRVVLDLRREVALSLESRFEVGSAGLLGERLVNLEPGGGGPVEDSEHVFHGSYALAVTDMIGHVEDLNVRVLGFLEQVTAILQDVQDRGGLGQVVEETTRAARAAADLLEQNAEDIGTASRTLASAGEKLDRFLTENEQALSAGAQGLATSTVKLDSLLTQLQDVATGADDVLTALREQDGALGKLIYDKEMGEDVGASVAKLKLLIDDVLRNPQRYLTVKIF